MILNEITNTCKYVMDNAKHVTINYDKLDEFIKEIDSSKLKNWLLYNPYNLLAFDIKTIINLLLIYESICYSFWGNPKWTIETEDGNKEESDALLYIIINHVRRTNSTDFSNMTLDEFKDLLKGNVEIPLLKERYKTITEVSKIVNEKMNGDFYEYIKNITSDTELFDVIVNNFKSFKDERKYNNKVVYFYKLAQLLTSDILHIREYIENIKVDYSNLKGCADYRIPQTLRALEITEYSTDLANIIDNRQEIDISSQYEIEIRASQMVVIDYIKNKLTNVNSIDINDFLFIYSKKIRNVAKPNHLCRNTNY